MKRVWLSGMAGLLGLAMLAGSSFGDDQPTTTTKAGKQKHTANKPVAAEGAAVTAKGSKAAAKPHLPAGFGKVNLTAEQHQRAVAVMDKYAEQIKHLESQIHDLKSKRDGELNALLSDAQKKSLADSKAMAQKMRAQKLSSRVPLYNTTLTDAQLKRLHDQQEKQKELQEGKRPAKAQAAAKTTTKDNKTESKDKSSQDKTQDKTQEKK